MPLKDPTLRKEYQTEWMRKKQKDQRNSYHDKVAAGVRAVCGKCQEEKSLEHFYFSCETRCKNCIKEAMKLRRKERICRDPEVGKHIHRVFRYGITPEEYFSRLEDQNQLCKICKKPQIVDKRGKSRSLGVDHDHQTGKIRGLLCVKCNLGLGYFMDDLELLKEAIKYLEEA